MLPFMVNLPVKLSKATPPPNRATRCPESTVPDAALFPAIVFEIKVTLPGPLAYRAPPETAAPLKLIVEFVIVS
jgi:hypothetical protein